MVGGYHRGLHAQNIWPERATHASASNKRLLISVGQPTFRPRDNKHIERAPASRKSLADNAQKRQSFREQHDGHIVLLHLVRSNVAKVLNAAHGREARRMLCLQAPTENRAHRAGFASVGSPPAPIRAALTIRISSTPRFSNSQSARAALFGAATLTLTRTHAPAQLSAPAATCTISAESPSSESVASVAAPRP
jgi:hypothetical protein